MTNSKADSTSKQDTEFLIGTFWIVLLVCLFAIVVVGFYVYHFHTNKISLDPTEWGNFGDYVGGIVNPVAGIATVILVFLTLAVQRKELKASLAELKVANESATKMSFEQSLFAWLANYHSLISAIEIPNDVIGRKALQRWYRQSLSPKQVVSPKEQYHEVFGVMSDYGVDQMLIRLNTSNDGIQQIAPHLQRAVANYQQIYWENRTDFDAPFRTLFRLIRWVDESELSDAQKWHYVALVRAQLSWVEQVFLFYNCITPEGKKMAFYANRYALFDNLVGDKLIDFAAVNFTKCPSDKRPLNLPMLSDWPYQSTAFSSKLAKEDMSLPIDT